MYANSNYILLCLSMMRMPQIIISKLTVGLLNSFGILLSSSTSDNSEKRKAVVQIKFLSEHEHIM